MATGEIAPTTPNGSPAARTVASTIFGRTPSSFRASVKLPLGMATEGWPPKQEVDS
jgi:hypothetical protein